MVLPPRKTLPSLPEDPALDRRITRVVDEKINDLADGLRTQLVADVKVEIAAAVAPVIANQASAALARENELRDRDEYRKERELRERIEKEQRDNEDRTLSRQKSLAEIRQLSVAADHVPVENARAYRKGMFATAAIIVAALAGLIGAAIGSHH